MWKPIDFVAPVPYEVWYNAKQDRKVSITGSCPWFDGTEEDDWEKIQLGWTLKVVHKDGSVTFGLGRRPFPTKAEADSFANRMNNRD